MVTEQTWTTHGFRYEKYTENKLMLIIHKQRLTAQSFRYGKYTKNILIKYNNDQSLTQNQDKVEPSIMPRSCFMKFNLSSFRGLIKISVSWLFVSTNSSEILPFWTWSCKKWCLISIYLVLECWMGFLLRLIALVLSHLIRMWSRLMP